MVILPRHKKKKPVKEPSPSPPPPRLLTPNAPVTNHPQAITGYSTGQNSRYGGLSAGAVAAIMVGWIVFILLLICSCDACGSKMVIHEFMRRLGMKRNTREAEVRVGRGKEEDDNERDLK